MKLRTQALAASLILLITACGVQKTSESPSNIPVKGMVTMVDFGAESCIPCKMMAPVLKKLGQKYKGRAAIVLSMSGKSVNWRAAKEYAPSRHRFSMTRRERRSCAMKVTWTGKPSSMC